LEYSRLPPVPVYSLAERRNSGIMNRMQAAFYTRQGPAREVLQVGEQPLPVPGRGEVRVKLYTCGVNPSDWKVRRGGFGRGLMAPLVIPHSDGAGIIEATGEAVARRRGERVWIWNGQWKRPFGTAAQYIVVPSAQAVNLPDPIDYAAGACLGIPALTAIQAVTLATIQPGDWVLISGGAGAVAHYAIQLAKMRGARVITTVSSDAKGAHAGNAGADVIVNYTCADVVESVKAATQGAGVARIIEVDLARNAKLYPGILRPHSTVVIYGTSSSESSIPSLWLMQNSVTLRPFLIYEIPASDRAAAIAALNELLASNRLIHTIAHRLPLHAVAQAHEMLESGGVIGNVVLEIPTASDP